MRALAAVALLTACSGPLPEPTLPTIVAGNAETVAPQTEQWAILGPDELVLSMPGITDVKPDGDKAWASYRSAGTVRISLVDGGFDEPGEKALQSLFSGLKPEDPHVVIRADASLPVSTLITLTDQLHWGRINHRHLQVSTADGDRWLVVDGAGNANRGLWLTPTGLTAVAHRFGSPAFEPPAVDDVQTRASALVNEYRGYDQHTVVVVDAAEEQTIQRLASALASFGSPRMVMEPISTARYRSLQDIESPHKPKVALDRVEIVRMDGEDATAHDKLIRTQVKLVKPGLLGVMPCFIAALESDPAVAGELPLEITLGAGTTDIAATGDTDEALGTCAADALAAEVHPTGDAELELVAVYMLETAASRAAAD